MGEKTKIGWTHHTFNAWIGCAKVSPACKHCYAADNTFTRVQRSKGRELWGVGAERHLFKDAHWREPLKWNRDAEKAGERRRVFCGSMMDVLELHEDLEIRRQQDFARHRLFDLIRATPWLDWLLLTKRPENAELCFPDGWMQGGLPCWLGTTVENQEYADLRIPHLLRIPARVRFLSCEPLLGPLDLSRWVFDREAAVREAIAGPSALNREQADSVIAHPLDWVIAGGESGHHSREHQLEWSRSLRDQCKAAGTAFFFKQLGEDATEQIPPGALRDFREERGIRPRMRLDLARGSKGEALDEIPADLRVRDFPR